MNIKELLNQSDKETKEKLNSLSDKEKSILIINMKKYIKLMKELNTEDIQIREELLLKSEEKILSLTLK